MSQHINEHDQPIGQPLPDWQGAEHPGHQELQGQYALLAALDTAKHTQDLFNAFQEDPSGKIWTYNTIGPFPTADSLRHWADRGH